MSTPHYAQPAAVLSSGAMPLLGFGTWQIDNDDASQAVQTALEAGYRHIDTATGYANEAGIGDGLRAAGLPRDEVFVTTKMPPDHVGQERATLQESLDKLGLDHVDLWLIHWPPNKEATPKAWEQFIAAQSDGLTKAIGVSNYSLDQIDTLVDATDVAPAVNQIQWAPPVYDAAVAEGLRQRNVVLEGYSPFKASNLEDPTLVSIAERHSLSTAQVIVAWHVAHAFVVIPKSTQRDRIIANAVGAHVELTADEVAAIDGLSEV